MYSDYIEEEEKEKSKKEKNIKEEKSEKKSHNPLEKEEDFYGDFYEYASDNGSDDDDIEEEPDLESNRKKATRMKVAITTILLIVLAVLVVLLTRSCDHKKVVIDKTPEVIINNPTIELKVGEEVQIDYQFNYFKEDPSLTFTSMDEEIVTVSEDGLVKALKEGKTEIVISYFVDKAPQEKTCEVIITKKDEKPKPEPTEDEKPKDKKAPVINATIVDAKDNTWTNHDVVIKVSAKDDSKVTLQYVLDCTNNCKYNSVSDGKINITKNGTTIVNIQAKDASNNKSNKKLTIKIDKDKPTCSLSVNSDGNLSANPKDNIGVLYSGFSSSYSGSNETSKKVGVGDYTYYVKDQAGNTNTCSINVKSKVQYRSRTCEATHLKYSGWYQYNSAYTTRCSFYSKYEAEQAGNSWYHVRSNADASQCSNSSPCYLCVSYGRTLLGCNWGNEEWSSYQDTKPEETKKVQVEEKTIFYS